MLRSVGRSTPALLSALALSAALLTGCSGGDEDGPVGEDRTPEEVMELAKEAIDETSGLSLSLSTDDLPDGVTGIVDATGIGTHAPAFEGSLTVRILGQDAEVPVVAVDGKVYAQVPFTDGWQDIDPAEYGAPDPAELMSTDAGFSALLPATTDLEEGESVRGGANNDEVLTEYTGTVPDTVVQNVIPGAAGDFDATYTVTAEGQLRTAVLTGVFYADAPSMTYTIGFDDYGATKDITAP
ncbi:LppX_LprAFG lipoprotein [Nocardioides marmotae]|uniref:LppX_LprAFG lipoprotein n=1 Tax=Nocardioides marmotae TaxID=2663857 RepID=UPI0012B5D37E|nr:LppX_LprAFG lipoprotein [Nocardioides marmotae]MBC9731987.1 LppX_LprAFG lipoprotein [Nocardioides marmotae]MTB83108.1 LppX_LprAFG lipoprotein [Nocardioides marmotae]